MTPPCRVVSLPAPIPVSARPQVVVLSCMHPDDRVATIIQADDGELSFWQHCVGEGCGPTATGRSFAGIGQALDGTQHEEVGSLGIEATIKQLLMRSDVNERP